ncbi:MAG TPA: diguanylate cyclase [Leptolyngbyaceae cyanobacterium M33_DOE_097]|uniref:Sensor domain-containing diguanylate cyclase n=1 Tax=Oscillatoriales cyanobacterium SpSt-418 TaxID=2282169 RepID=A0A7C3KKS7_9CYAN|nr:diguanylate cyclase [Leptolyngbyaceae cyanobacterium M33_DOE_097]
MLDLVPIARDLLIENMQDGVIVLDKLHRVVDINPAAQRLIGLQQKALGTSIEQIFPTWHDIWLHRIQTGSRSALALQGEQTRYVELQTTELRDRDQRIIGFLLIVQDVTHRYQAETQLRQANQCLQQQLIEIESLQAQLRDQAIRDGLTGLHNRRYLEEQIHHELAQAAQTGQSVAVLILDIDFFKQINDTYGHQAGDRVLQAFGKLLRQHTRASDLVCRYGGEEFVVVMPGLDLELATQRAEAIRKAFQTLQVVSSDKRISSTISIGLGIFPQHGNTFDKLLHVVDLALYAAKTQGRNAVISVAMLPDLRLSNELIRSNLK